MNINFITSFLFLLSSLYSWYRNVIPICIGCSLCLISSIIYHGCLEYNISINKAANNSINKQIHSNIIWYPLTA